MSNQLIRLIYIILTNFLYVTELQRDDEIKRFSKEVLHLVRKGYIVSCTKLMISLLVLKSSEFSGHSYRACRLFRVRVKTFWPLEVKYLYRIFKPTRTNSRIRRKVNKVTFFQFIIGA